MRIELLRHGGCIGGEADNGHAALAFPDGGNGRPLLAGLRAHRRIPEWAILNPAGAGGPENIPLSASGQMLRCKKSRRIAYARARVIVDRKSVGSGKGGSVRVDPGGRRNIKKKKKK